MRLPNGMTLTITGQRVETNDLVVSVSVDDAWLIERMTEQGWSTGAVTLALAGLRGSPDAMRLNASLAGADAEMAEWRALLDGAKRHASSPTTGPT